MKGNLGFTCKMSLAENYYKEMQNDHKNIQKHGEGMSKQSYTERSQNTASESQSGIKAITKPWKTTMKNVCFSMYEGCWPHPVCLSVGLYTVSHKNYQTDIHETLIEDGSRPRIDPVNFWCRAMNLFSLFIRLFLLLFSFISRRLMHWSGWQQIRCI